MIQSGVPVDQFITRKLWDVGNTAPFGQRGDLTTMTEAGQAACSIGVEFGKYSNAQTQVRGGQWWE